jgi:hypothetical protein
MQAKELSGDQVLNIVIPPIAAASAQEVIAQLPYGIVVTSARWIPGQAVTANGTNYCTMTFRNRGQAGAGTVQWATARAYSATNSVALTAEALTLSSTASDLKAAAMDLLTVAVAHTASGLALPAGVVSVTYRITG